MRELLEVLGQGNAFLANAAGLLEMMHTDEVRALKERAEHAKAYRGTAATFRARAGRQPEGSAERLELERRAQWYDDRAAMKQIGAPMPRSLRTPRETLEAVGVFRELLGQALGALGDLDGEDLDAFDGAIIGERPPAGGKLSEAVYFVRGQLVAVLRRMGVTVDERGRIVAALPFGVEIATPGANQATGEEPAPEAPPAPATPATLEAVPDVPAFDVGAELAALGVGAPAAAPEPPPSAVTPIASPAAEVFEAQTGAPDLFAAPLASFDAPAGTSPVPAPGTAP